MFGELINVFYEASVRLREFRDISILTRSDIEGTVSNGIKSFKNWVFFEVRILRQQQMLLCLDFRVDVDLFLNQLFLLAKFHLTNVFVLVRNIFKAHS